MKKFLKTILFLVILGILFSCSNKNSSKNKDSSILKEKSQTVKNENSSLDKSETGKISYSEMKIFFNPSFEKVESENSNQKSKKTKNLQRKKSSQKSESVIPGLRSLSDYKTIYNTKKAEFNQSTLQSSKTQNKNSTSEDDNSKEFFVEDWGPKKIVSENENPTFYVVFSQSVKAISALEEPQSSSSVMMISPKIKGTFHWYGAKNLVFEASEAAEPGVEYTITIDKNLKSLKGKKLLYENVFTAQAEPISIEKLYGGFYKDGEFYNYFYDYESGIIPPYNKKFFVRLNYPISEKTLNDELEVFINEKKYSYNAKIDYNEDAFYWSGIKPKFDKNREISNSFIVEINDEVPANTSVIVKIKSSNSQSSYETLKPFSINNVSNLTSYSQNKKSNPLQIRFTQKPDLRSLVENTKFDFDFELSENNVSVEGKTATFYNLPISSRETHKIIFNENIKDVYGQKLNYEKSNQKFAYDFEVSPPVAYSKFQNYGTKIMEAQFPHKIIFEYQNINPTSKYFITSTKNPLDISEFSQKTDFISINPLERDQNHFVELELDPYLTDGLGVVKFEADIDREYYDYWNEKYETRTDTNIQTIQVTDIGATVRCGINRLVAFVSSMKTGEPIENATVQVFGQFFSENQFISDKPFASGTTDKNGLCVINFTEEEFNDFEKSFENLWGSSPIVKITNGNDSLIFKPNSHEPYSSGIYPASYKDTISEKQRTFIFVDRGVYKPGETVTYRGIDRTQHLGKILTHTGAYYIQVTDGSYYSPRTIIPIKRGSLSESGGFYGSFELPSDIAPGTYCIEYSRAESKSNDEKIRYYFTVAEFERLKIESSVEVPKITYFGGDKINANLSGNYLAGGNLSDADYMVSYFRQPTQFSPKTDETIGFIFGPENNYSPRDFFNQDNGKLNSSGKANISCNTEQIFNGSAYNYRIEASITDISNQRVTSVANVLVHPAEFYVGLKRNGESFAKKGEKLNVNYILVNAEGTKLSSLKKVKELNYSLSRTVWSVVNENGVYDSVYTRYEESQTEEASGKIDTKTEGKISVDLTNAGWYTLKVFGYDSENRYVESDLSFYASGSDASFRASENSQFINLTPSSSLYKPGENAQILMESPLPSGDYLITVEREGIFSQEVRHFDDSASVIEIPISKNYVPVVYVSVASYSVRHGEPQNEYGEVDLDKPKGYYGVTNLFIDPKIKSFSIEIETDKDVYRPGEEAIITLTATKGGKPYSNAELTLMAVDRGVLDLINYHVPNPIDFFYSSNNFPLSVFGGDSRAYLLDPVTYNVKNLQGGDSDETKESERNDFRPTAVFEPVLITDKNGQVKCTFKMPDNLTTYRITAFGVKDDIFALNEDEIKVQNPINVQVVTPRRLRERDTAETGVLITNLSEKAQKISVKASVLPYTNAMAQETNYDFADGLSIVSGDAFFDGKTENSVVVQSGDSSVVYFDLAARTQGKVQLTFEIKSDVLNEKIKVPLEIEKTFTYETVTLIGTVQNDEKLAKEEFIIPDFAKEGNGSLKFTLDATRLGMLGGAVNYLFRYPYGCLEQQSSKVLPLVIFGDYIDIFGLDSEIYDVSNVVKQFVKEWGKVQHSDGGFPYWQDSANSSYYVSLRIAHIFAVAKSHGYNASDLKIDIDALKNYLKNQIENQSQYIKSYVAYIFSLLNDDDSANFAKEILSSLNNKNLEKETLTNLSYIGLAYKNLGDSNNSAKISQIIRNYLQISQRSVSIIEKNKRNTWEMFESEDEQFAVILQLLVTENPNDVMVDRLIFTLMQNQSKGYWKNTATTSHVLEAIYTYIKMRNLDQTDFTASTKINGEKVVSEKFENVNTKPKTLEINFTDDILKNLPRNKEVPLEFEKSGTGQLYYTMEMKYALPDEMLTSRDEGLKLNFEIVDNDTKQIVNKNDKTSLVELESGKLYKAKVRIESTKNRNFVALRCPIPSGCEILDSTFVTSGFEAEIETSNDWNHYLSNKVIYDNEIQFFYDTFKTGSAEVTFTFRAVRRGVYPTPSVIAECMYESEIFGRNEGYLFTIR